MERAARVLRRAKQPRSILNDQQALQAAWPAVVGKAIARHTCRLRLVRTTVVVEVEDQIWQRQLRTLESQILDRIRLLLPDVTVTGMEFRIEVERRQPQRAAYLAGGLTQPPRTADLFSGDEADRIQDPVLKKIYQMSRRKASA